MINIKKLVIAWVILGYVLSGIAVAAENVNPAFEAAKQRAEEYQSGNVPHDEPGDFGSRWDGKVREVIPQVPPVPQPKVPPVPQPKIDKEYSK